MTLPFSLTAENVLLAVALVICAAGLWRQYAKKDLDDPWQGDDREAWRP